MTELPDKPSELIRLALADLEAVEKDPLYRVDMHMWHQRTFDSPAICEVCFAGAVMARTLGAPHDDVLAPISFDPPTSRKLYALDSFRTGNIGQGLGLMNVPIGARRTIPYQVPIRSDAEGFKDDMRQLATMLEEVGL